MKMGLFFILSMIKELNYVKRVERTWHLKSEFYSRTSILF